MMKQILMVFFLPFCAVAADPAAAPRYSCAAYIVESGGPGAEFHFQVDHKGDSHGGKELTFSSANHELTILANGTWLGISWQRNKEKIAEGVFVIGSTETVENRVAILYDPKSEDQVSLNCSKILN